MPENTVDGFVDERFRAAPEAFEANLTNGADMGASSCATLNGETIFDLWAGGFRE